MKKERTCIRFGELFQSCITSSFTSPIVNEPPSMYTIPGHAFTFGFFFPEKNQPFWSFGFHPVELVKFLVPPPFFLPPLPPPQLINVTENVTKRIVKILPLFIFFICCFKKFFQKFDLQIKTFPLNSQSLSCLSLTSLLFFYCEIEYICRIIV